MQFEYTYDTLGRLIEVDYSDSTPDVTHTYRRDTQRLTTTDVAGTRTFTYVEGTGQLSSESIGSGLLAGLQGTYTYDAKGRPAGHSTQFSSTGLTSVSYGYDSVGRWNTVSANGLSAEYHYATNSNLVSGMSLEQGTTLRVSNTKTYDDANRLTSTTWADQGDTVLSSHSYLYDGANRRVRSTLVDGSYWEYAYNAKGEVTGAVKKNASGTPFPGLQYGYSFDEIGNRVSASVDAALSGTRSTSYTSNALNQYTSIGTPNAFDVIGSAASSAIVKVNTETADRLGPYFRKEVTVNNSASAVWQGLNLEFTLSGAGVGGGDIVTQRSGHHYVAPATSSPTYDEDGNLTSDSRWTYSWDGENRLVATESNTTALSAGVPKRRLEFLYDGQSRRISKKVMDWNAPTSAWVTKDERRFVYDGWNLVAELNASGSLIQSHTWGMDLSGTAQSAGGVGGLLWSNDVANTQVLFAAYDGNGNVVAMISTCDSQAKVKARYDYNAFGETVLQEGDGTLVSNAYRFSTKYQDEETGLYYYGYRYYNPLAGRWLNRDPIAERGGLNLYGMVGNDAVNNLDYLGREKWSTFQKELSGFKTPQDMWDYYSKYTGDGGKYGNGPYVLTCHCGLVDLIHLASGVMASKAGKSPIDYMRERFNSEWKVDEESPDSQRIGVTRSLLLRNRAYGNAASADDHPSEALGLLGGIDANWKQGVVAVLTKCKPIPDDVYDQFIIDSPKTASISALTSWPWSVPKIIANEINASAQKVGKPCCPSFDPKPKEAMLNYFRMSGLDWKPSGTFNGVSIPPGIIVQP